VLVGFTGKSIITGKSTFFVPSLLEVHLTKVKNDAFSGDVPVLIPAQTTRWTQSEQ
jgi:hypothetical protein